MRFVASTVLLALLVSDCCTAASLEGLNPSAGEEADYNDEILAGSSEDEMVGCGCDSGSTRQGNWNCGCGNNGGYGLNEEQQALIVQMHNVKRSQVASGAQPPQPKAQDMLELVWDNELAQTAQNWSNICAMGKRDPNNQERGQGQNLAWGHSVVDTDSYSDTVNKALHRSMEAWYNEVNEYYFRPQGSVPSPPFVEHYTQIVWSATQSVGCGITICGQLANVVCNYFPGGNIFNNYPYNEGDTNCSGFNFEPSRNYDNLCIPYQ